MKSVLKVACLLLCGAAARAQSGPALAFSAPEATVSAGNSAENVDSIITFRKRVNEVAVVFTVVNKRGRPVRDLKQSAFQVLDDHKPPQNVVSFASHTDLPLRVGMLVDASSSVRDRFGLEQQAASQFLSQIIRPRSDQAFVLGFDSRVNLAQDFTSDKAKLQQGIRRLRDGGGTALYDAIAYACREKMMTGSSEHARRAIVVLSDGEDNQSSATLAETIALAQRAEVIIYAISTNYSNIKMHGDQVLQTLADATGGHALFPLRIKDVTRAFAQIEEELRSQYVVAYRPADFKEDGRYRTIQILAANNHYLVRARKGYYAPTQ